MNVDLNSIITIVVILIGPFVGIWGNGILDRQREQKARKMDIFRTLMRTRNARLSSDHVGAINLVEIEFVKHQKVIEKWTELRKHYGETHAKKPNEENDPDLYDERLNKERVELLTEMLSSMAEVLDFKVEQLRILKGSYYPQGHADMELAQFIIRDYAVGLAFGKRNVPVEIINLPNNSDSTDSKNP